MSHSQSHSHSHQKPLEINITIGESFIRIVGKTGSGLKPTIQHVGELDSSEYAAIAAVMQVSKALCLGIDIGPYYNPTPEGQSDSRIIKVIWMKSGKLKLLSDEANKKFQHADTIEEAISRHRVFTCTRELFKRLPKIRKAN